MELKSLFGIILQSHTHSVPLAKSPLDDFIKRTEMSELVSYPLMAACSGHAIAKSAFLLLATDYRIGVDGALKLT
jgi:enoyl-CoA hydratase